MQFTSTGPSGPQPMIKQLFLLFSLMFLGLVLAALLAGALGVEKTPMVRIVTIFQDLLVFALPAVVMALVSSRLPAQWLAIDRKLPLYPLMAAVVLMIVSIPFQNFLISWNSSITLPAGMEGIARWMTETQERADASLEVLLGGVSVADLILNLLIVGVMAGLCEELFFRGALQRIISDKGRNPHVAIWVTAVVFSAFHLQFFGFFPRLLLGALFGYLLWWSGSLWLPVMVHILNNSVVVVTQWVARRNGAEPALDRLGTDSVTMVLLSVALTAAAVWLVRRLSLSSRPAV